MEDIDLIWTEESRKEVFKTPVFSIQELNSRSPQGEMGRFSVIDAPDWAIVVPALETEQGRVFLMVRQWRHGAQRLSLEFPGGVFERGERGEEAAARELREETGYTAGHIRALGEMSPNPAIMSNRVHFYLAQDLRDTGRQELDKDEYVGVERVPVEEVLKKMGQPPYIHSLMASALALYLRQLG
ncbi:MAG: NUDIX hydrolase [Treponema sp.]|nr:NUDIX hydrolase [Treponema sp.]